MKNIITILTLLIGSISFSYGQTKRVLFLGNSYTSVNNLPQIVADVAASLGDTLIFDSNSPGGYTFQGHSTDATSLAKIALGNWDYVILQEQSQRPSFPISQVETDVFPYAHILDSIINAENQCAETVFYMTWGRKNGDASNCVSWPPVCTYSGMDSLLNLRYRMMADSNNAIVSPVGAVWENIRQNFPLIDLYQADESHPSVAGSYAAACCFYTALFRKDPTLITFNSGLSATDAANIKNAAKLIVYDNLLNWHIGEYDSLINVNCLASGINEESQNLLSHIYPNPATSTLTIKYTGNNSKEQIQIFNSIGILIKEMEIMPTLQINIVDLPNGLYFLHLKNYQQQTLKFIKQ